MSLYVVDAGVAVKWFIPEPDSDLARQLLKGYERGDDQLIAPDFFIAECANVFWKRADRGDLTKQEATDNLNDLLSLNLSLSPSSILAPTALLLSQTHRRAVYDCLYLSLALSNKCEFLTADERFYNSMAVAYPQVQLLRNKIF